MSLQRGIIEMLDDMGWRYFAVGSGVGTIAAIVRCPMNELPIWQQNPKDIQVCVGKGQWEYQANIYQKMMDDFCSGWFDEENNRIQDADLDALIDTHCTHR